MIGRNCRSNLLYRLAILCHRRWWTTGLALLLAIAGNSAISAAEPFGSAPQLFVNRDPIPEVRGLARFEPLNSARTWNQRQVQTGINRWLQLNHGHQTAGFATDDLLVTLSKLAAGSPEAQRAGLNSLSGQVYATTQSVGIRIADDSLQVISNRLINNAVFLNDGDAAMLGQRSGGMTANNPGLIIRGQPVMTTGNGWIQGYGSTGYFGSDGSTSSSDYNLGGLAYGLDLGRDDDGVIGIAGGNTFTSYGDDLGDHGNVNSFQIGLYALKRFDSAYGFAVMNYGHNNNDISRPIDIGNQLVTASSSFVGHQFGSYGEGGLNLETGLFRWQPFVGLQYVHISNSQASENGAGGVGLNVAAGNLSTLQSHLGSRLILHRLTDSHGRRWTPYLSTRWVSDWLGQQATSSASLSGAPGASWTVTGNVPGRNLGMFGPGLTVELTPGMSLFANYEYQWADMFHAHTGSGGLLLQF